MSISLRVELAAVAQMRAAVLWWHENRQAAPDLLREELREAIVLR